MSEESELMAAIEACPYCAWHSGDYCDDHKPLVQDLKVRKEGVML